MPHKSNCCCDGGFDLQCQDGQVPVYQGGTWTCGETTFQRVNTYNDLPDPTLHTDEYWHVVGSQGTKWLPGPLGGTYYSKGFYYSDGVDWEFIGEVPWQATQADVDAGIITDQFVSPNTLANSTTVSHPGHTHVPADIVGGYQILAVGHPAETKTNTVTTEQNYATLYTIPANYLTENKVIRISALFQAITGSTTVTYNPYVELGGTKVYTVTAADPGNSVTRSMEMVFYIHGTAAAGASVPVEVGTANGAGNFPNFGAQANNTTQPVALATNTALPVVFGIQFSATTATESLTLRTFLVEGLN